MSDTQNTIGMKQLLDEIDRDLDEFRKKHQGDYSVKNVTLWWELQKDRLLVRHKEETVRLPRSKRIASHSVIFLAGFAASIVLDLLKSLL